MTDLERSAREWAAEVDAAYADGGYAAGDGPPAPLEEVRWLLDEVDRLRDAIATHERDKTTVDEDDERLWSVLDR